MTTIDRKEVHAATELDAADVARRAFEADALRVIRVREVRSAPTGLPGLPRWIVVAEVELLHGVKP